jgi:hypothetical protein
MKELADITENYRAMSPHGFLITLHENEQFVKILLGRIQRMHRPTYTECSYKEV